MPEDNFENDLGMITMFKSGNDPPINATLSKRFEPRHKNLGIFSNPEVHFLGSLLKLEAILRELLPLQVSEYDCQTIV